MSKDFEETVRDDEFFMEAIKTKFGPEKAEKAIELMKEMDKLTQRIDEEGDFDSHEEKTEYLKSHNKFQQLQKKFQSLTSEG